MRRARQLIIETVATALVVSGVAAHAQHVEVGASITAVRPRDGSLSPNVAVFPVVRLAPARGWGLAGALDWFSTDVDGTTVANLAGQIGRLQVRPFMGGVGYTFRSRFTATTVSMVVGPSLNTFTPDGRVAGTISVAGSGVERNAGSIAVAFRPGVSVSIPFAPRLSVTGFAGYLVNRPSIALNTPSGFVRQTWRTDSIVTSVGVVFRVF